MSKPISSMYTILFIYHHYSPSVGGIETLMQKYAEYLSNKNYDVIILTGRQYNFTPAKLPRIEVKDNITIIRSDIVKLKNLCLSLNLHQDFRNIISNSNGKLLAHIWGYHFDYYHIVPPLLLTSKRIKFVHSPFFNLFSLIFYSSIVDRMVQSLFHRNIGKYVLLNKASAVFVSCPFEEKFLRKFGVKSNIYVIPEGIDLPKESIAKESIANFREKIARGKEIILLSIGRIDKRKGYDRLIKAVNLLEPQLKRNIMVIIIGPFSDVKYKSYLSALINKYSLQKNVIFMGYAKERTKNLALASCDIVVNPSLFESFNRIALEAWVYKKPIIAYNVVGYPVTSETGILVKYGSIQDLVKALTILIEDPSLRNKFGSRGFQLVLRNFLWKSVIEKVMLIYNKLLS